MIIIIDKYELLLPPKMADKISRIGLKDVRFIDCISEGGRLTNNNVGYTHLLIITDKERDEFRVMKDRYGLFPEGKVFNMILLEKAIRSHNLVWLFDYDTNACKWEDNEE